MTNPYECYLKTGSILMDKESGDIILITAVTPLYAEEAFFAMVLSGEEQEIKVATIPFNSRITNLEYIGEL